MSPGDLTSDPAEQKLVHSLLTIWNDERARRRSCGDDTQFVEPLTQDRDLVAITDAQAGITISFLHYFIDLVLVDVVPW